MPEEIVLTRVIIQDFSVESVVFSHWDEIQTSDLLWKQSQTAFLLGFSETVKICLLCGNGHRQCTPLHVACPRPGTRMDGVK